MDIKQFDLQEEQLGARVDVVLSGFFPDKTRSALQKWLEAGLVTVDGVPCQKNHRIRPKDRVLAVSLPPITTLEAQACDIALDILFEDEEMLVVNKAAGMVVHPAPGHPTGTLVNALLHHCRGRLSAINGVERPGIVHRIDKDTSGLLMVAKTDRAHAGLSEQVKAHSILRRYDAMVTGHPKPSEGIVEAALARHPSNRLKRAVSTDRGAKLAKTGFETVQRMNGFSQLRCTLYTGRTHQIRVHMAHLGHPLAGDALYGGRLVSHPKLRKGQLLHAGLLGFVHPVTGEAMRFEAPLPDDLQWFILERGGSLQIEEGMRDEWAL